jgi:hypothetical protein
LATASTEAIVNNIYIDGANGYEVISVTAFGSETYVDDKSVASKPIVYLPVTETEVFPTNISSFYF